MSVAGFIGDTPVASPEEMTPLAGARDVLRTEAELTLQSNPLAAARRWYELENARDEGVRLDAETARARLRAANLEGALTVPDQGITEAALDILIQRKRDEQRSAEILARSPGGFGMGAARLAVQFGASLMDPINIASGFVPVIGQARYARLLEAAGGLAGRTAIRAGVGAAEGAVGAALIEPLIYASKTAEQADYDLYDSMANIAFGSVFGGGLHVIGGAGVDAYRALRGAEAMAGGDAARAAADLPEVARASDAPQGPARMDAAPDPAGDVAPSRAADAAEPPARLREAAPARADWYEVSDAMAANGPQPERVRLAVRDDGTAFIERADGQVIDATAMAEAGWSAERIVATAVGTDETGQNVRRLSPAEAPAEAAAPEAAAPEAAAPAGQSGTMTAAAPDAAVEAPPMSAADRIARAAPETREAALRVAVAQAVSGREIDVEPVVNLDPAAGEGATAGALAEARAAAERNASPENATLADPVAAAETPQPAPPRPALDEARAALDDALAEMDEVVKAGAQAYRYSRAEASADAPPATPAEQLTAAVRAAFGDATDALVEAGRIKVVNEAGDVPGGPHPEDVRAVYAPDGTAYLVAANMPPEMVRGVVLHEVGVHAGMEAMLGREGFARVLGEVDRLIAGNDAAALRARGMVPDDTPAALVREETLGYLVQNEPDLPLVRRIVAAVKAWVFRVTDGKLGTLGPGELVSLARSALRKQARDARVEGAPAAMAYSRGPNPAPDPKGELRQFDEAIARAELYAAAVRAAAQRLGNDEAARLAMRAATADKLAASEIDELLARLKSENAAVRRRLRGAREQFAADDTADALQPDALRAADTLANNVVLDATIQKRNAALALAARTKAVGRVLSEFGKNPVEGVLSLLGGSQFARIGSKDSVFHWQRLYFTRWTKGMLADLERDGLVEAFVRNVHERDVARALYQMGRDDPALENLNPDAVRIARTIYKYREDARNTRNRYGAWIRELTGYIARQSHDFIRIRAAGPQAWKDFVRSRIDVARTLGGEATDIESYLDNLYLNFAAGRHLVVMDEEVAAVTTPGSLARKASQSRVLYFKNADAEFEYLKEFGAGKFHEAILGDLSRASQQAGLLRILGPNPVDTLARVMDEVEEAQRGDPEAMRSFAESRHKVEKIMEMLDGRANAPASAMLARVGGFTRAWQAMAKLGGAVVSSITDLPNYAGQIRYQGRGGLLSGTAEAIGAILKGRPKGEQREILRMIDTVADGLIGGVAARFDSDDLLGGKTSELMRIYFRMNGLQWWTDTLRESMELGTAHWLGGLRESAFADLKPDSQRVLGLYGITESEWQVLRLAFAKAEDGRTYLVPEAMNKVSEDAVRGYVERAGRTVTEAGVANARRDLADRLRNFIIDQAMTGVLEPDVRSRYVWLRGSRAGTAIGEAARFIAQFKGFPTAYARQVLGREIYGRGYDSLGDYLKRGHGDMLGLAQLLVSLTIAGYVAMSAKDLLKGKTPRPPDDLDTWKAAFLQGGGAGIYGDFLLGQTSRFGRGILDTLVGPTIGTIADIDELRQRVMRGDDVAASAFRVGVSNTPFMNLFYIRTALDYLILYRIQEALNPGYLRRMEQRVQREQGQEFLLRPTEVVQ